MNEEIKKVREAMISVVEELFKTISPILIKAVQEVGKLEVTPKDPEKKGFQRGLLGYFWDGDIENKDIDKIGKYRHYFDTGQHRVDFSSHNSGLYDNFEPLPGQWIKHDGSDKCPIDDEIWNDENKIIDVLGVDSRYSDINKDAFISLLKNKHTIILYYMIIELPKKDTE
jgi:hypothetical protein